MHTQRAFASVSATLGIGIAACTVCTGSAAAKDPEFTVVYGVSAQGLDLNKPSGARALYARLKHAADVVCTHGMRVDLAPPSDPKACYEQALGQAVRSVKRPLLTQVYLETHTVQEATARGIDVPVQLALQ